MASSSGSDSEDSDDLDLDLTPEDMQAIMDAEERLEKNVYDYDGQAQVRRGWVHAALGLISSGGAASEACARWRHARPQDTHKCTLSFGP